MTTSLTSRKMRQIRVSLFVAYATVLQQNVHGFSTTIQTRRAWGRAGPSIQRETQQSFVISTDVGELERVTDAVGSSVAESGVDVEEEVDPADRLETISSCWIKEYKAELPAWVEAKWDSCGERLVCAEWELADTRAKNGWRGYDFMHDDDSPVKIVEYFSDYGSGDGKLLKKGGEGTTLTGIVHFTARAESHQGFCHGGINDSTYG